MSIAGLGGPRPDGKVFAVAYSIRKDALITLTEALAPSGASITLTSMPVAVSACHFVESCRRVISGGIKWERRAIERAD